MEPSPHGLASKESLSFSLTKARGALPPSRVLTTDLGSLSWGMLLLDSAFRCPVPGEGRAGYCN